METILVKHGHAPDTGTLRQLLRRGGRVLYGYVAGYGVGTRNILASSAIVLCIALLSLIAFSGGDSNAPLYFFGGFVGATPGLEATPIVSVIIGIEALVGALLIALYINALGRRSSM